MKSAARAISGVPTSRPRIPSPARKCRSTLSSSARMESLKGAGSGGSHAQTIKTAARKANDVWWVFMMLASHSPEWIYPASLTVTGRPP